MPGKLDSANSPRTKLSVRIKQTDIENTRPPIADLITDKTRTRFHYFDLDGNQQWIDIRPLVHGDHMQIPMRIDREGYCKEEQLNRYWFTGLADWRNVAEAIHRYLPGQQFQPTRVFDFGCATGRFLRHVWTARHEMDVDIWGCDYSPQNVDWCRRYLDPDIKVFLNYEIPHLPIPDSYFDVTTAFSVLTHIDQFEESWLLELRRVTRDDGLLYVTVQNQSTWDKVPGHPNAFQVLQNANRVEGNLKVERNTFENPMPEDRIALKMRSTGVYDRSVWMNNDYIRRNWGRFFEVLHIADAAHLSYQSVVVLRPLSQERAMRSLPHKPR